MRQISAKGFITNPDNADSMRAKLKPDLVALDMRVPDMDSLEAMGALKQFDPKIQCVMLSGFGDVESAVSAIKQGAFDSVSQPFKMEEVLPGVNRALFTPGSVPTGASPTVAAPSAGACQPAPGSSVRVSSSYNPKSPVPKGPPPLRCRIQTLRRFLGTEKNFGRQIGHRNPSISIKWTRAWAFKTYFSLPKIT